MATLESNELTLNQYISKGVTRFWITKNNENIAGFLVLHGYKKGYWSYVRAGLNDIPLSLPCSRRH